MLKKLIESLRAEGKPYACYARMLYARRCWYGNRCLPPCGNARKCACASVEQLVKRGLGKLLHDGWL